MPCRHHSSALVLAGLLAVAYAQQSVYVPGNIDDTAGVSIQELGVGADGLTSYAIGGATLVENSQAVTLTQYDTAGEVVYNCVLGADAQATCSVSQVYDGVTYGYTEPVTYFSGAGATVTATATSDTASAVAAVTTSSSAASSTSSSSSSSSSASSSSTGMVTSTTAAPSSTTAAAVGPKANAEQATSSNVFAATGAAGLSASIASSAVVGSAALLAALCML